jgi:antitoxin HicB
MVNNKHIGQSFDDFLRVDGIYEEVRLNALKKALAHQLKSMMDEKGIRKSEMARRMKTSRSSLDRLFNPVSQCQSSFQCAGQLFYQILWYCW